MVNTVRTIFVPSHAALTKLASAFHYLNRMEAEFDTTPSEGLPAKRTSIATFCCMVWGMAIWRASVQMARSAGLPMRQRSEGPTSQDQNPSEEDTTTQTNKDLRDKVAWKVTADNFISEALHELALTDRELADLLGMCQDQTEAFW